MGLVSRLFYYYKIRMYIILNRYYCQKYWLTAQFYIEVDDEIKSHKIIFYLKVIKTSPFATKPTTSS